MKEALKEKLIDTAGKIAENIYSKRFILENEVAWVYKVKGIFSKNAKFTDLDYNFYNGEMGLAYFFLYASKYLKSPEYFNVAYKIYNSGLKLFQYEFEHNIEGERFERYKEVPDTSGLSYPLVLLNFMDHADVLNPEKKLWDDQLADTYLNWIEQNLSRKLGEDLFFGLSGCICCLLNIYERKEDKRFLTLAIACADKILNEALAKEDFLYWHNSDEEEEKNIHHSIDSFGFGSAGVAFALSRIYSHTKKEEYLNCITRALACRHEAVFPIPLKEEDKILSDFEFNYSWLNGHMGKILGKMLVDYFTDKELPDIISFEDKNKLIDSLGNTFALNAGDTGFIEVIRILGISSKDELLIERMDNYIEKNIDEYNLSGKFNFGKENPLMGFLGLFDGEAGIGYQMLRFALWESVPSLLALESPMHKIIPLHTKL